MSIYELEKLATPGPVSGIGVLFYERVLPSGTLSRLYPSTEEYEYNSLFNAHCRNNFLKALEALKEEHERVQDWLGEHGSSCGGLVFCKRCKLIAELEDVK